MHRIAVHIRLAVAGMLTVALPQIAQAGDLLAEDGLTLKPNREAMALADAARQVDEAGRAAAGEERAPAFMEGSWTLEPLAFAVADVSNGADVDLYGSGVGASYYFADDLAIRGEALGMFAKQTDDDAVAGGINLHGRWHYFRREGFTLFFEGGGGLLYANKSIPDASREDRQDGTNFNFVATMVLGATFQIADDLHLNGGFRYVHVSNARRHGIKRNPSTEGIGGQVGLIWTF